jgi:tetratricopeptide (TPR) repeat protein
VEVAPEGDLATDLLLLRADLALAAGRTREAGLLARRCLDLAKKGGNIYTAAEVHRVLGNVARSIGDLDRSLAHYQDGVTALRAIEAPYPLALALLDLGRAETERLSARQEPDRVLAHLEEAFRLFRGLKVQRYCGEALLALARAHVKTGAFDRASATLAEATEILRECRIPQAMAWVRDVQNEIEERFVEESSSHLNEFRATHRIQEILDRRNDAQAKVGDLLEVIAEAVEADGALVVAFSGTEGELHSACRMSPAVARRIADSLAPMRQVEGLKAQIVLNTESCADRRLADLASSHSATSLILIPIRWPEKKAALLYIDRARSGRAGSFRQTNLNSCVVLSAYLADLFDQIDREERVSENLVLK